MSKYDLGQHAIVRNPKGEHAIERFPLGAHGIYHPASWYIKRGVAKRSMPAVAVLLTSSLAAGSVSIPLRAVAVAGEGDASIQTVQLAPDSATLVLHGQAGILIDTVSGCVYDATTRLPVDMESCSEEMRAIVAEVLASDITADIDSVEIAQAPDLGGQTIDDVDIDEPSGEEPPASELPTDAPAIDEPTDDEITTTDPAVADDPASSETPVPVQDAVLPDPLVELDAGSIDSVPIASIEASSTVATASVQATSTELQVAARLLNAGWTPEMVAALLGNMYAESGSNAASYCNMSGMFHYAYEVAGGLFQWTDAGSSPTELSCAGFTGLSAYAAQVGKDWTDVGVQIDYFLQTWREGWAERQTYYDALHPDFADTDVSLAAFDETLGGDFDEDGIVDAWDDDVDGDGILNADDPVTLRVKDDEVQRSKAASAARVLPMETAQRSEADAKRHIEELTFAFMAGYEGPAASVAHFDRRAAHALGVYPAVVALDRTRALGVMDSKAALVIAGAETMLGGSYVWGAESPATKTFDCSGLTKWCYSLAGLSLAHFSESQYVQASKVYDVSEAVPGDILWKLGHVGIYIGNGRTIEAKGTGYGIVYGDASSFAAALHFDAIDEPLS